MEKLVTFSSWRMFLPSYPSEEHFCGEFIKLFKIELFMLVHCRFDSVKIKYLASDDFSQVEERDIMI